MRVTIRLIDAVTSRHVWAAAWDGDHHDPIAFVERFAIAVARAVQPALRAAEVERASRIERSDLTAWELTMRALPCITSIEAAAEGMALELLQEAIERAPHDPLPIAMAAWCHGLRAGHHFSAQPEAEKAAARELAAKAVRLNAGDALAESMLAAGYTLAHDLEAAAVHAKRALALDGGCAWAWGRSAWVLAYAGRAQEAIEEFQIARSLAPADPLNFGRLALPRLNSRRRATASRFAGTSAHLPKIPQACGPSGFSPPPTCLLGAKAKPDAHSLNSETRFVV